MYEKLDNQIDKNRIKEAVNHNAEKIINQTDKKRIREEDFYDVFGKEEVANDLQIVARLEDKFDEQLDHLPASEVANIRHGEKLGQALEVIIAEQGEKYQWAGSGAHFIRTSRYDDTINNVDLIIEFELQAKDKNQSPRRLALAVDASRNIDAVGQKINKNVEKLTRQNGRQLPSIKYFQSTLNPNVKGPLEVVVPVVIGLEAKHANELINLSAPLKNIPEMEKTYPALKESMDIKFKETEERFLKHPAQAVFYRQIRFQLQHYLNLLDKQDDEVSKNYRREIKSVLDKFKQISASKKDIKIGKYEEDQILVMIEHYTKNKD